MISSICSKVKGMDEYSKYGRNYGIQQTVIGVRVLNMLNICAWEQSRNTTERSKITENGRCHIESQLPSNAAKTQIETISSSNFSVVAQLLTKLITHAQCNSGQTALLNMLLFSSCVENCHRATVECCLNQFLDAVSESGYA